MGNDAFDTTGTLWLLIQNAKTKGRSKNNMKIEKATVLCYLHNMKVIDPDHKMGDTFVKEFFFSPTFYVKSSGRV
jgi:hypothetical protein